MKNNFDLTHLYKYVLNYIDEYNIQTYLDMDIKNQLPNQFTFTAENIVFNYDESFYWEMIRNNPKLQEYGAEDDSILLSRCQLTVTGIKGYQISISELEHKKIADYSRDCKIKKGDLYYYISGINAKYANTRLGIHMIFTGTVLVSFEDEDILCKHSAFDRKRTSNAETIFLSEQEIDAINFAKKEEVMNKGYSLDFITTGFNTNSKEFNENGIFSDRIFKYGYFNYIRSEGSICPTGYTIASKSEE